MTNISKTCKICNNEKFTHEFYKNSRKCKSCCKKLRNDEKQQMTPEQIRKKREYNRKNYNIVKMTLTPEQIYLRNQLQRIYYAKKKNLKKQSQIFNYKQLNLVKNHLNEKILKKYIKIKKILEVLLKFYDEKSVTLFQCAIKDAKKFLNKNKESEE